MKEWIAANGGFMAAALVVVSAYHLAASGLGKAIEKVAEKTENKTDDKLAAVLNRSAAWALKILDWFQGNRVHK